MIARASSYTLAEVAQATQGTIRRPLDEALVGVSTDTRDALHGHLFIALVGEHHDAHDHLDKAVEGQAAALLVQRGTTLPEGIAVLEVDDTLVALQDLARHHRRARGTVLALTGSNGKTSTKEMLASILEQAGPVLKTQGNLNNHVGLPLTLLGWHEEPVAVVEMGMNAPGEIACLAAIAEPDVGLVTNVGPAHLEGLGSIEAIAAAKGELFSWIREAGGVAVVNADDPLVSAQADNIDRVVRFGSSPDADVQLLDRKPSGAGQVIQLAVQGRTLEFVLQLSGRHQALNAAAAAAGALALGGHVDVSDEDIQKGLAELPALAGRGRTLTVGDRLIIDDGYNANRASMLAAIEAAYERALAEGRRLVCVLGEMRELGAHSDAEHAAVGQAAGSRAAVVLAFGSLAGSLADAATKESAEVCFESSDFESAWSFLQSKLQERDTILVKGSRGIRMERFVERLEQGN